LWTTTPAGRSFADKRGLAPSEAEIGLLPFGIPKARPAATRQRNVPILIALYRLLAHWVQSLEGPVRVAAWEHPWKRTLGYTEPGNARGVRLPGAAVLVQNNFDSKCARGLLLLTDVGTRPVASYQPTLRRLIDLRVAADVSQLNEPLLVVGVAVTVNLTARVAAWRSLLDRVAQSAGEQSLHARVVACPNVVGTTKARRRGEQVDQVLGLVARHPLLERRQLATLLNTSTVRTGQLVRRLAAAGWTRSFTSRDMPSDALWPRAVRRRLSLVVLTPSGRREAARRLVLPATDATRHHGLLGSRATETRYSRHLAHTLGANEAFVAFVAAARRKCERGGDEALVEWRSAAACARGRFRPDGYGCYQRQGSRFGFFLEFDRGTEKGQEYAAKLAAFYRYRDSSASKRDYAGFPALLVVTTSESAEARFAVQAHLAEQRHSGSPLSIFLTTTAHIDASPDGVLGRIWRSAADPWAVEPARIYWLP
jgi:hypothetical protein